MNSKAKVIPLSSECSAAKLMLQNIKNGGADVALEEHEEGVIVRNICCSDIKVKNEDKYSEPLPFGLTKNITPGGIFLVEGLGFKVIK